jgi:hypothetical protein
VEHEERLVQQQVMISIPPPSSRRLLTLQGVKHVFQNVFDVPKVSVVVEDHCRVGWFNNLRFPAACSWLQPHPRVPAPPQDAMRSQEERRLALLDDKISSIQQVSISLFDHPYRLALPIPAAASD